MNAFNEFAVTICAALAVGVVVFCIGTFSPRVRAASARDNATRAAAWANRIFRVAAIAYALLFAGLAITRYLAFGTGYLDVFTSWDLGLFNQAIWNSLQGRVLENSFIPDAPSYLGKSFSPILLAFVPLYAMWSDPRVLLIAQAGGLALAAFPIYWHARARLGYASALVIALVYFLFPGAQNIALNEFHDIALEAPVMAFAIFFLLRRRYAPFLVCVAIGLLVKEEIAVIALGLGAYIFLAQRRPALGLGLAAFGLVASIALLQFIIPAFRSPDFGAGFYYFGSGKTGGGGSRYGYLGTSVAEIIFTFVTRFDLIVAQIADANKVRFLFDLLIPLAFLPLLGFEIAALALPTLGYSLLSTYPLQSSIKFYYFAPIIPALFFALIAGLERAPRSARAALAAMVLTASAVTFYFQAPAPFGGEFDPRRYRLDQHAALGRALIQMIPADATVVAQNEFLAPLSNRRHVYEIPMIPDYRQTDFALADTTREWYAVHRAGWQDFATNGFFETVVERDGYWLAKPRAPAHLLDARFGASLRLLGYTIIPTDTLRGGTVLRPVLAWRADAPLAERLVFSIRVADQHGHIWASETREPHAGQSPTDQWRVGKTLNDQYALRLPPTMPTGEYVIAVQVREQEIELTRVRVEKNKSSFTARELYIEQPLQVDMREMRLLGFAPTRETLTPGELLSIGVYWRAREKPRDDYLVAIQLRDASGNRAFEHAARPANDAYPTTQWDAGEVLLDWHDVNVPRELAPGAYDIWVILRQAATHRVIGESRIVSLSVVK
ncbi:MAG: DUF2079 domain-containing protein [Chloroflexi bacterium]|nr:DUF2079 domain-containing protein [Chloroflexota bacterium]